MTYLLSSTVGEADIGLNYLSRVVRKLAFCICENKDADQLRFVSDLVGNPEDRFSQNEAHLNLSVNTTDSVTIKLLSDHHANKLALRVRRSKKL